MKKIGFIDFYLDEWHANNYPTWIRENAKATGREVDVIYAWAETDNPNGLRTDEWCAKHQVQALASIEEVVEKADYLIVLSPDHPEHHERLGKLALMSGKPVYMDKTFSPDLDSGKRMFKLAEKYKTPLFSSSALRFSKELIDNQNNTIQSISTTGPGTFEHYSVHQFEIIVALMGTGAERMKSLSVNDSRLLVIEYGDGRQATFSQLQQAPFQVHIQLNSGESIWIPECTGMFPKLMDSILVFFETGIPPVPMEETLEIMALIDAGKKAIAQRDSWVKVVI